MQLQRIGLGLVLVAAVGCSGDDEGHVVVYADGSELTFRGTTAPTPETIPEGFIPEELAEGDGCVETIAYGCDENGTNCGDTFVRSCSGVVEKLRVDGCFKNVNRLIEGTETTYIYDVRRNGQVVSEDRRFFLGSDARLGFLGDQAIDPFGVAFERFNELFAADGGLVLDWQPRSEVCGSGGGQGNDCAASDLFPSDITDLRVMPERTFPGFPNAAGVAQCLDSQNFGRRSCVLTLITSQIVAAAERTGASVQDIANAVALHEIGHAACIEHFRVDTNLPSPVDGFSAMNSFLLDDRNNRAERYFTLTEDDIAGGREAFEDEPEPGVIFARGFATE